MSERQDRGERRRARAFGAALVGLALALAPGGCAEEGAEAAASWSGFALPEGASGPILWVTGSAEGGPGGAATFASIGAAVEAAAPGAVILVEAGTWSEPVEIWKSVAIVGHESGTTIDLSAGGAGGGAAGVSIGGSAGGEGAGPTVLLRDLTVRGATGYAIAVGAGTVWLERVRVLGTKAGAPSNLPGVGPLPGHGVVASTAPGAPPTRLVLGPDSEVLDNAGVGVLVARAAFVGVGSRIEGNQTGGAALVDGAAWGDAPVGDGALPLPGLAAIVDPYIAGDPMAIVDPYITGDPNAIVDPYIYAGPCEEEAAAPITPPTGEAALAGMPPALLGCSVVGNRVYGAGAFDSNAWIGASLVTETEPSPTLGGGDGVLALAVTLPAGGRRAVWVDRHTELSFNRRSGALCARAEGGGVGAVSTDEPAWMRMVVRGTVLDNHRGGAWARGDGADLHVCATAEVARNTVCGVGGAELGRVAVVGAAVQHTRLGPASPQGRRGPLPSQPEVGDGVCVSSAASLQVFGATIEGHERAAVFADAPSAERFAVRDSTLGAEQLGLVLQSLPEDLSWTPPVPGQDGVIIEAGAGPDDAVVFDPGLPVAGLCGAEAQSCLAPAP